MKYLLIALSFVLFSCHQEPRMHSLVFKLKGDTLCVYAPSDLHFEVDSPLNTQYFTVVDTAHAIRGIYMRLNPYKMLGIDTAIDMLWYMSDGSLPAHHPVYGEWMISSDSCDSVQVAAPFGVVIGDNRSYNKGKNGQTSAQIRSRFGNDTIPIKK